MIYGAPIDFAEAILPEGQKPIQTTNVKRSKAFFDLIMSEGRQYPAMGTVTGIAGIGKTISIQAYCNSLRPQAHTGLPQVVSIKVKPRSTPKALAVDIVAALRDKPRRLNVYEVADEAVAAIIRNDLKLIIVDEADRLNEDSFEVLRHIHDQTGCCVVVVGLPQILNVIDHQQKFASRIGLRLEFEPLKSQEIIETVLPQMVFPHWCFIGKTQDEWDLGERIWTMVRPSLRNLRNLLQTASQLAVLREQAFIDQNLIEEAFGWTATAADKRRVQKPQEKRQEATSHEAESERRQAAKRQKKNR